MFSLPQGQNSTLPQNITDDDPLRLDDTANQFRALCWILYALCVALYFMCYPRQLATSRPLEIVNQHRYADMGRILPLVVIANKYGFRSLEEWGFDVLNHHCEGGLDFLTRCSVSELSLLADIAVLSDYTQYTTRLIGLIQEKSLSRLKVSTTSPLVNVMLEIGEKHSWDSYLGKVYSQIVHAITYDSVDTPIGLSESHTRMIQAVNTLGLKPEQEMRLYKGYIALVQFWDSFVRNRAKIDVELCPHNHNWDRCRENISQAWNSIFQAVSVSHPSADVDGKLGYIINQFASSSVRDWRDVHCWSSIRDRVKNIREDVLANIPRLFVGN